MRRAWGASCTLLGFGLCLSASSSPEGALRLAKSGKGAEALPILRSLCRRFPNTSRLWNDLGVLEMRMGELHKARFRFEKALSLEKMRNTTTSSSAQRNLDLLRDVLPSYLFQLADLRQGGGKPYAFGMLHQAHKLLPVPRMSLREFFANMQENDFKKNVGHEPFILTGAMGRDYGNAASEVKASGSEEGWKDWNRDLFSLNSLAERFGDSTVDFYPHNMGDETVFPIFRNLSTAIQELLQPGGYTYDNVDASLPGTYLQWNLAPDNWRRLKEGMGFMPELFCQDRHWLDGEACFKNAETRERFSRQSHWRMLLVGERGAGMFNHKDTLRVSSYQVQLEGTKRWHLCFGPTQDRFMYEAGDVNAFAPDYERYPRFKDASCLQADVEAGEMIFYNTDWWHQTQNLATPTVSLSGSIVDEVNWRIAKQEFTTECSTPRIMYPDEEV